MLMKKGLSVRIKYKPSDSINALIYEQRARRKGIIVMAYATVRTLAGTII